MPLDELTDRVKPTTQERTPIYQTMFALPDDKVPGRDLNGVTTTLPRLPCLHIHTELSRGLWPRPTGGTGIEVIFKPNWVSRTAARALPDAFGPFLKGRATGAAP